MKPSQWGQSLCMIAERFGWTFEMVGNLTLLQFLELLRYLGKQPLPRMIAYFPK